MNTVSKLLTSLSICAAMGAPVYAQSMKPELNKGTTPSAERAKPSKSSSVKPKTTAESNVANAGKTAAPAPEKTKAIMASHTDSASKPEPVKSAIMTPHSDAASKPEPVKSVVKQPAAPDAKSSKLKQITNAAPEAQKTK
jgi:hypothetical protein